VKGFFPPVLFSFIKDHISTSVNITCQYCAPIQLRLSVISYSYSLLHLHFFMIQFRDFISFQKVQLLKVTWLTHRSD
jgi:hypothetical protein